MMGKKSWVREEMDRLEREKTGEAGKSNRHKVNSRPTERRLQNEDVGITLDTEFRNVSRLASETGISKPDIRRMIKKGSLKKIMLPGRKTPVYSKQNLIRVIAKHNQI